MGDSDVFVLLVICSAGDCCVLGMKLCLCPLMSGVG